MNLSYRIPAFLAYLLPVIGWVYAGSAHRRSDFVMFHLRQAISLFLFLLVVIIGWAVIGWLIAWVPYGAVFSVALFAIVIISVIVGLIAWLAGMVNALAGEIKMLPMVGRWGESSTMLNWFSSN